MSSSTKRHKLRYPACIRCGYNLTGSPISDETYTCSECGNSITLTEANFSPPYIGRFADPLTTAVVPPSILTIIGFIPVLFITKTEARDAYISVYASATLILMLWIIPVAVYYSIKVSKWKGPNDWNGPWTTFLILSVASCGLTTIVVSLCLMISIML